MDVIREQVVVKELSPCCNEAVTTRLNSNIPFCLSCLSNCEPIVYHALPKEDLEELLADFDTMLEYFKLPTRLLEGSPRGALFIPL